MDRRLEVRVEAERLREAAVLGAVGVATGHQADEVVLDRERTVLRREGRRRLAGAGQADDHEDLVAVGGRDDLQARVQRETALAVDDVVPHAQAALLRLAEVVGVQDARDVVVEVDRDHAVVRVARRRETGGVDHLDLRLGPVAALEVELLLHAGDVRVTLLHQQSRRRAHLGIVADVAVDLDHVVLGDVGVLRRPRSPRTPRASSSCRSTPGRRRRCWRRSARAPWSGCWCCRTRRCGVSAISSVYARRSSGVGLTSTSATWGLLGGWVGRRPPGDARAGEPGKSKPGKSTERRSGPPARRWGDLAPFLCTERTNRGGRGEARSASSGRGWAGIRRGGGCA